MANEEFLKGYIEGFKEALATVGQDLQDHEIAEYSVEDYGKLYQNVSKEMGNCVVCKDIGSEKGCPVGKTIWCPRIMETLEEEPKKPEVTTAATGGDNEPES